MVQHKIPFAHLLITSHSRPTDMALLRQRTARSTYKVWKLRALRKNHKIIKVKLTLAADTVQEQVPQWFSRFSQECRQTECDCECMNKLFNLSKIAHYT